MSDTPSPAIDVERAAKLIQQLASRSPLLTRYEQELVYSAVAELRALSSLERERDAVAKAYGDAVDAQLAAESTAREAAAKMDAIRRAFAEAVQKAEEADAVFDEIDTKTSGQEYPKHPAAWFPDRPLSPPASEP